MTVTNEDSDPKVFTDVLIADVLAAQARLDGHDTASARRDFVRTALASVEGLLWFLKVQVFEVRRTVPQVTSSELDAIFERSYTVAENGTVRIVTRYVSMPTTFRLLARVIQRDHPDFDPDFGSEGWHRVRDALKARNRISHPKGVQDLEIAQEDVVNARAAFNWTIAFVLRAAAHGAFGIRFDEP